MSVIFAVSSETRVSNRPWNHPPQIDGFRFDIMGHLLVSTLEKMRSQLDKLTLEKDGVDGR